MAWAMAIFLILLGTFAVGICLGEILPKIGYIIGLCCGLCVIGIGLAGISDLSRAKPEVSAVANR